MKTVSSEYLDGIREGRQAFNQEGMANASQHLENLNQTCRRFDAQSPVGQMLRGERDFWRNQIKKAKS